jgi:hypothetical protein
MPNSASQQFSAQLPTRSAFYIFSSRRLPLPMNNQLPQNQSNNKRKRDEAQTNSLSRSFLHASGSAGPIPPNSADRPPSAPPIGHARRGRKKYVPYIPSYPNRSKSTVELPLEHQPVPALLTHEPPSTPHISNTSQDNNQSMLPHLDLAAPGAIGPCNYDLILDDSGRQPMSVAQTRTAGQCNNVSASPRSNLAIHFPPSSCRSAPDSLVHRPPSPAFAMARLQGTTEYVLRPLLINTSDLSRPFNWSITVCAS